MLDDFAMLARISPQFHIAQSWGIHEATVWWILHKVENLLVCSGRFRLAGKRHDIPGVLRWDVVVVDVREIPMERRFTDLDTPENPEFLRQS
jgi:hypothetical protein